MYKQNRMRKANLVVAAFLAGTCVGSGWAQNGVLVERFQLIELPAKDGGESRAYAVNDIGQVIGWMAVGQTRHSAHWHNRVTTDLHGLVHFELKHPIFDQDRSEGYAISNGGQIVGTAWTMVDCDPSDVLATHAFVARPAVLTDLATPYPGDALTNLLTLGHPCIAHDSVATGISNKNHIVGWADRTDGVIHAFLVRPQGGRFSIDANQDFVNDLMIDLGIMSSAADPVSSAHAVNDLGYVTGYAYVTKADGTVAYHAYLLMPLDTDNDGVGDTWFMDANGNTSFEQSIANGGNGVNVLMLDLGTLGGTNSWGRDVNNNGLVVGESDFRSASGERVTRAFRWSAGTMMDLGTLRTDPNRGSSSASGVNDSGDIVGWAENDRSERRAFVYRNGQMQDLNTLLYLVDENGNSVTPTITLTEARDINADGVIVGWGAIKGSNGVATRAFLLSPVLVDPSVFDPNQNVPDGESPRPVTPGGATSPLFSSQTDFGPPTTGGTGGTGDGGGGPVAPAFGLCGAGALTFLPVMLVGLGWMRLGNRKR